LKPVGLLRKEKGLKIKSKALEANIADYRVGVTIDAKYSVLQEVMPKYYGLMDGLKGGKVRFIKLT
jgi:hypothetical protein